MMQWFPGHMAKGLRQIRELAKVIDLYVVLLDARIPFTSYNPELMRQIASTKPCLFVITKQDLSDRKRNEELKEELEKNYAQYIYADLRSKKDVIKIDNLIRKKAQVNKKFNRRPRVLILGIPNVGKSTLINRLARKKITRVGDMPGVTRGKQWITLPKFLLMDTPGILWPKFDHPSVGLKLALTGAIRLEATYNSDFILQAIDLLRKRYNHKLIKLGLDMDKFDKNSEEILIEYGKSKKMLEANNQVDIERVISSLAQKLRHFEGATLD